MTQSFEQGILDWIRQLDAVRESECAYWNARLGSIKGLTQGTFQSNPMDWELRDDDGTVLSRVTVTGPEVDEERYEMRILIERAQ